VEFYAPWCGHCKKLEPLYEKAATALKAKGIHIAKVDATKEEKLATLFEVKGFPTLKLFKDGVFVSNYEGPRTAEGIVAYMEKKQGSPLIRVSSAEEVEKVLANEKYGVVVGYFDDLTAKEYSQLTVVAEQEDAIRFFVFSDAAAASGCLLDEVLLNDNTALKPGAVVVLGKDGSKHLFSGDIVSGLVNFFNENVVPQSTDLDPALYQKWIKSNDLAVTIYDYSSPNAESIRKSAIAAVATHPELKQFLADSKQWAQALTRMKVISGKVYPTSVIFKKITDEGGAGTAPFSWDEEKEWTESGYTAWIAEVLSGTASNWILSEPIPATNDEHVKVVVAKTFDELVINNDKDVLLEFYAPWCGHCKNLEPIYKNLAEHFAKDNNIVIAKMDATANFVDHSFGIQGFPTIKFFPANNKKDFINYEGARTLDDLISFVGQNKHATSA